MKKRVIAKRSGDGKKRKPTFICSAHPKPLPMSYDAEKARWVCTDEGCVQTRRPQQDPDTVMSIRSKPQLVIKEDEDGDLHPHLFWPDYNIMVAIPFSDSAVLTGNNGGKYLRWHFNGSEVVEVDVDGDLA